MSLKEKLILELYKQIWQGVRLTYTNYIQYLIAVVSILVILKFGLEKGNDLLFITVVISQYALIWILLLVIEFAYKYRIEGQGLSIAIENAVFGIEKGEPVKYKNRITKKRIVNKVVIPSSFREPDPHLELPELNQIYFFILYLFFSFLSMASIQYLNDRKIDLTCPADIAAICGLLTIIFLLIYYLVIGVKCPLFNNKTCWFLLIMILPWFGGFMFMILLQLINILTKNFVIFLNWLFGTFLIIAFYCYRNKRYKEFIESIK
jgi:hypothetical protein